MEIPNIISRSGSNSMATRAANTPAADENRSTLTVYDGLSNVAKRIADLDRSGALDADDQAFMSAAQGCWY